MASHRYRDEPSAPPMYPDVDNIRPVVPKRSDVPERPLLPPEPPERSDRPSSRTRGDGELRRDDDDEKNTGDINNDCIWNYNRYATRKTIGHALFEIALIASNIMQLRTLILQKQHDTIWIVSLILVCISIVSQIGLAVLLYIIMKGDIRNSQKQSKFNRYNNFALLIILCISILNVAINILMMTINPKSFLDTHSLEILQQYKQS